MSAIMDPAKLKVVELRAELSSRGLDTKGNKPVLVKRLREALKAESGNDLPDTSIADTSTEDINTSSVSLSQSSPQPEAEAEPKEPERVATPEPETPPKSRSRTRRSDESSEKPKQAEPEPVVILQKVEEKMDISKPEEKTAEEPAAAEPVVEAPVAAMEEDKAPEKEPEQPQTETPEEEESAEMETTPAAEEVAKVEEEQPQEQDVEMAEGDSKVVEDSPQDSAEAEKESSEPRNRKSRWGSVTAAAEPTDSGGAPEDTSGDVEAPPSDQPRGEKRRNGSPSPERVARKRSRSPIREDEPEMDSNLVTLSWIDSDLNLQVNKEGFSIAEPMHSDGFGYMWAGVRSTHGVSNGKVWYEVKLLENCDWKEAPREDKKKDKNKDKDKEAEKVEEENKEKDTEKEEVPVPPPAPAPVEPIHVFRVGWSLPNTDLQLGEQPHSYAYDSEGFSATDSQFTEFGAKYAAGDVVGAFLNMDADSVTISYTVNGELQPTAFTVERSQLPEDSALFPHILTRNIKFEVNFGQKEEPWFKPPEDFADFTFIKDAETKVAGLTRPADRKECEVVMMVGLPCSGKTQWVNNHVTNNPEKRYNVLGLGGILDKMKYQGKPRKENFKGSVTVLMDKSMRCLTKLIDVASSRRRNFIIDQTNLFSSAQRRKMRPFDGFRRQAVVIVVADDEQSSREKSRQQADGKDVPDSAVLEMKANMCLPSACDWLDEVTYAELDEEKSKEMVQKYNKQGREAGYGPNYTAKQRSNNQKQQGGTDRRGQWNRNNKRDNGRDNRNQRWGGGSGSGGGGGGGGGGQHRQNNWGGGNRGSGGWGRQDNRNHHHGGGGGGGRGGDYRNNSNNRMMSAGGGGGGGGGGYNNRNQGGSGGYNRNRNHPPHRNQMQNKGGSWGGPGGGGSSWNNQGSWGNQGGWGGHQSGGQGGGSGSGWSQGSWGQYGNNQGGQGGGNQQWKGGYNAQQYQQQGYAPGYAGQYGQGQYPNWNYYGQYAQGWNAQQQGQQGGAGSGSDSTGNTAQYNQYTQQQQAAWAQYAQGGYGGYGQAASQGGSGGGNAITGSAATQQTSATKQ